MESLEKKIKAHFEAGHSLTVVDCLNQFRTIELRKIVSTLRREGMKIGDEWVTNPNSKKKFKRYFKLTWVQEQNKEAEKNLREGIAKTVLAGTPTFQENTSRISMDGKRVFDSMPSYKDRLHITIDNLIMFCRRCELEQPGQGVAAFTDFVMMCGMNIQMADKIMECIKNPNLPYNITVE